MKSVVIIGSTSAIGQCLCRKYAKLGWKIAIVECTQNARAAQPIVDECFSAGSPKTVLLKGDLCKETEWRKIVTSINQQIGEAELIIYLERQKIDRLFKEINQGSAIKKLMENNYVGPVYAIHNFLSTLRRTSGQFVITGVLDDEENALDYASFQAVHGFVSTLQREEKNISFSYFYPIENAQEFPEVNVDLLVNSIHQKKQKICLREISRIPKKRESLHLEVDYDDPPPLKPETANPLSKAIFKANKIEVRDAIKNSRNIVGLLEEKDEDGRTALHYASYIGCGEIFNIVARKVKVKKLFNDQDKYHCTPLHLAALRGHILLCKKLIIRYAADPSVLARGNMTPLHYLARLDPTDNEFYTLKMKNSFEKTLKALMDAGADSNQRNSNWGTPLHEAARAGSLVTISFLLKNEGDLFRKTLDGNETPLHFAIRSGNRRSIAHLLDNGADPCAACVNGTCFDIAPTASVCDLLEHYREKNRRQSDTFHARETVVVESLQDLPPDAQKMIASSRLTNQEIMPHWDTLLFLLRFLTKRNYIKRGDPIPVIKKSDPTSKTSLGISLHQATERFVAPGNPRKLFKIIEDAGRGGFGTVYKARRMDDKKIVAIKKVPHLSEKEQWNNFDEIHFLQQMGNHSNVVRYHTSYFSRDELWIIMEFLEGGTLSEVIGRVKLDETHICYVAKNILKGLKDMHKIKVIHRDLKSANIMLNVAANVKLIDFGLCIDITNTKPEFMVGSPFWIPPEMMHRIPHGAAADIWSLGILCLEMANRSAPNRYSSLKAMFEVGIGNVPKLDNEEKWSKGFKSFLDRMLVINPDQRTSAKDLLEDPWIKNISRNAVNDMREVLRNIFLEKSMELSMV